MKSLLSPFLISWLSIMLIGAAQAAEQEKPNPSPESPGQLQLIIDFGVQRNRNEAREAGETFAPYVTRAFRLQGYAGKVQYVRREKAVPEATTLVIHMIRWRLDGFGVPECIFVAGLYRDGTITNLGEFSGSDIPGGSRYGEEILKRVAERPLRDLAQSIRDKNLLPGFVVKKKN
jgi:hypothetical protein